MIKKLLIISCSTGSGHVRSAESLRLYCQQTYPQTIVLHIDVADYMPWLTKIFTVSSYDFFSASTPGLYRQLYKRTDNKFFQSLIYKHLNFIFKTGSGKLLKKITDFQPDSILTTHFFPLIILPRDFTIPIDTVVTDFHAHIVWLSPRVRNFFVADEITREEIVKNGFNSIVAGIPIDPIFYKEKNPADLKSALGIKNSWPTILIMPISKGSVKIGDAIRSIFFHNQNANVAVVCGRNEKSYESVLKIKSEFDKLIVLKKVSNVDEWMRISDVVVSKAGGVTISEALRLRKPLIVVNPIPGQEEFNGKFLEKSGYCLRANSSDELAKEITGIINRTNLLKLAPLSDANYIILQKILG